jgi:hypothetical protein
LNAQLTKKNVDELNKLFNDNYNPSWVVDLDGELFGHRLDVHKAKTEKYVGKLCQYLAAIKGYKYWPKVKKRGE